MKTCIWKTECGGDELVIGINWTSAMQKHGLYRCRACDNARSIRSNAIKAVACDILGVPRGVGSSPDGSPSAWMLKPEVQRKAALVQAKRELDAANDTITPVVPEIVAASYSGLTAQEARILDERRSAYKPQDEREERRLEGSVYCRVLGVRLVDGRHVKVCKIGYAGIVKDREQECDRWSIDGDEETAWRIEFSNARWLETEIHNELKMQGKHRRKEIFNVDPVEAKQIAKTVLEMAGL